MGPATGHSAATRTNSPYTRKTRPGWPVVRSAKVWSPRTWRITTNTVAGAFTATGRSPPWVELLGAGQSETHVRTTGVQDGESAKGIAR